MPTKKTSTLWSLRGGWVGGEKKKTPQVCDRKRQDRTFSASATVVVVAVVVVVVIYAAAAAAAATTLTSFT